jgi:hypothetical protein
MRCAGEGASSRRATCDVLCNRAAHDGDPVGAARHALQALKPGGTVLLVEPFANDNLEQNFNPVGAHVQRRVDLRLYAELALAGGRLRSSKVNRRQRMFVGERLLASGDRARIRPSP